MPAARYWRLNAIETYDLGDLELSEVALHDGIGRVDNLATLSSVVAPLTGSLAALGDVDFNTTVVWSAASLFQPGFALVFDFGAGNSRDILKVGVAGPSLGTFAHRFVVESSADGVAWDAFASAAPASKWASAGTFFELTSLSAVDTAFDAVTFLLHADGANGSTTFTDSSGSPRTPSVVAGNTQISTAQAKFGGASIRFDGTGDYLEYANNAAFELGTGDFTLECFVYLDAYSAAYAGLHGVTLMASYRAGAGGPVGFGWRIDGTVDSFNQVNVYTGNTTLLFNGANFLLNTWYHLAVCRVGGNIRVFVNGAQYGATAVNSEDFTASQVTTRPFRLGQLFDNTYLFALSGYMDEVRITKGFGRYTGTFVPPAAPFPGPPTYDLSFNRVALLANFNGVNGSTVFPDTSPRPKVLTAVGGAQIDTAQSKFGGASLYLPTTNDYLTSPQASDFDFGLADFTVEAWVRLSALGQRCIVSYTDPAATGGAQVSWFLITTAASTAPQFTLFTGGTGITVVGPSPLALNTQLHLAATRTGNTLRLFLNGVLLATNASAGVSPNTSSLRRLNVGRYINADPSPLLGHLDDLRITTGVARYTANFTPPTAEFQPPSFDPTPLRARSPAPSTTIVEAPVLPFDNYSARDTAGYYDREDGGDFRIVGTVKEVALPTNTPLARRVRLAYQDSGRVIRETFSDSAGNYVFDHIRGDRPYIVTALDYAQIYRPVAADQILAEPYP